MTAKEKRKYLRAKKKRAVKKKRVKKRAVTTGKESVEKRVKDTILREDVAAAGTDVLLAGRDFRLCLEVPPAEAGAEPSDAWRGVPGVHVRGKRTTPLSDKSVPRERWLHVAFVCRAAGDEPRPRLELFVDGASAGAPVAVKNLELKLPMRDFGGDRDSVDAGFHGLLLEARYWKGARSPQELVEYMHRLPPADRLQQGMVGWWTFEEGEGRYAFDRSELRYRSRIQGGWRETEPEKRVAWATPFGDAGAPTPASREAGVCPVELRLVRLAEKARRALELIPCERCGAEVLTHGMRAHVRNHCVFREVPCDLCGKLVVFKDRLRHRYPAEGEEADCPVVAQRDALAARHAGGDVVTECRLGCGARLPKRDRARHEKERCRLRPATCPNAGCGAVVAFERLRDHVANLCEDPYFVARRRMIRKYRAIRKYGRPWAATPDSDGESGGDSMSTCVWYTAALRLEYGFRLGCHDLRSSSCRMQRVRNAQCPSSCCKSRESETIQHTLNARLLRKNVVSSFFKRLYEMHPVARGLSLIACLLMGEVLPRETEYYCRHTDVPLIFRRRVGHPDRAGEGAPFFVSSYFNLFVYNARATRSKVLLSRRATP